MADIKVANPDSWLTSHIPDMVGIAVRRRILDTITECAKSWVDDPQLTDEDYLRITWQTLRELALDQESAAALLSWIQIQRAKPSEI